MNKTFSAGCVDNMRIIVAAKEHRPDQLIGCDSPVGSRRASRTPRLPITKSEPVSLRLLRIAIGHNTDVVSIDLNTSVVIQKILQLSDAEIRSAKGFGNSRIEKQVHNHRAKSRFLTLVFRAVVIFEVGEVTPVGEPAVRYSRPSAFVPVFERILDLRAFPVRKTRFDLGCLVERRSDDPIQRWVYIV